MKKKGIALVAVLAILTVLAILAAAFIINMRLEQNMSQVTLTGLQENLLVISACEHTKALLESDNNDYDSLNDIWSINNTNKFFYVKNKSGQIIGRYKLVINDESSKININTACLRKKNKKNVPVFSRATSPSKIALNSIGGAGTLLSFNSAKKLLMWRYGKNHRPGRAHYDDNGNASAFAQDGIDNDDDGIIDEPDEGIDEPEECVFPNAYGDDKFFDSVDEAAGLLNLKKDAAREFKRRTTVFSSESESISNNTVNINASSPRKLLRAFKDAKLQKEYKVQILKNLSCNIADYADENNVLATLGNEYGVEAVCFNEILANDGSVIAPVQAYDENIKVGEKRVPRAGAAFVPLYSSYNVSKNPDNPSQLMYNRNRRDSRSWYVFNKPRFLSGLNGSTAKIKLDPRDFNSRELAGPAQRRKMLNNYKKAKGGKWPVNLFKGSYIEFPYDQEYFLSDEDNFPGIERKHMYAGAAHFKIVKSGPGIGEFVIETKGYDTLPQGNSRSMIFDPQHYKKPAFARPLANFTNAHCNLIGWQYFDISGDWTCREKISEEWIFPAELPDVFHLDPNTYYTVTIQSRSDNFDDPVWGDERDFVEYYIESKKLDTDGNYKKSSFSEMWRRRFSYMDEQPLRSSSKGTISIVLTSSDECTAARGRQRISRLYSVIFTRPEVVEFKNVTDKPISLKNWTLVSNSGSLDVDISKFDYVYQYEGSTKGTKCENPVIKPNGYFYVVNDVALFDYEFGSSKDGIWGTVSSEKVPVFPISKKSLWGIHYKIKKVDAIGTWNNARSFIQVANENWQDDQLKGEYIEIVKKDKLPFSDDLHNADGIRLMITHNTKDTLFFEGVYLPVPDAKNYGAGEGGEYVTAKDEFFICGLPRKGGFVSLTLKNQYNQICSRTAEYGDVTGNSTGRKNEGWSTEKIDPTHYNWKPNKNPTFGGTENLCKNKSTPKAGVAKTIIRNRNFVSKAELLNVKKEKDWENIGNAKSLYESRNLMKKLAPIVTADGYFLYSDAPGSHKQGWKLAGGKVSYVKRGLLKAENANWKNGTWKGNLLRFISGKLSGKIFPVKDNYKNTISVFHSGSDKSKFNPNKGDKFVLGPGYFSAFYYTENDNEPGVWEWQIKNINPDRKYDFTLKGLNDSIDTTEFLEENHNAKIDIELWNFNENTFVMRKKRAQYDKTDMIYLGKISSPFISPTGSVKIRITPHDLQAQGCSGKAWFNYAIISPKIVQGRVNINTASKEILLALEGISKKLAANIANGIDKNGKPKLKPYKSVGDLLDVKGMNPEILYLLCPQVTVRSSSFSAEITVEVIKNSEKTNNLENLILGRSVYLCYFNRKRDNSKWNVNLKSKVKQ